MHALVASVLFCRLAIAADAVTGAPWLAPALTYDGTALADLRGGARRGSVYVGNLHLKATASGDAIGLGGASAFVDVLNVHGGRPSRLVGDAQGTSNIEAPAGTEIEELWLQQNGFGERVSALAGIYDLNSEFYRLQSATLFLNSAFGIGPEFAQSGIEGPSIFPRTSFGVRLAAKPDPNVVVRGALLNGVPVARPDGSHALFRDGDGTLAVLELAVLARPRGSDEPATRPRGRIGRFSGLAPDDEKIAFGSWRYSGRFADPSDVDRAGAPVMRRGSSGAYVVLEHVLSDRAAGALAPRATAFLQGGIADPRTNRFSSHLGAGIVASGWSALKESDQFGLSLTRVQNGSHEVRALAASSGSAASRTETTLEATYLAQIDKALTVQPDLQYVIHPGTDRTRANAWVAQLRFEVSY